jgi:hypothetical protein
MSYMLLIVESPGQRAERSPEAGQALYEQMRHFMAGLEARGVLRAGESLASTAHATRLEIRDGRRRLIDGPFAEAKEMIGGFFLLNCETAEEALAIATECPAAQWCTVEIRKVGPCFD